VNELKHLPVILDPSQNGQAQALVGNRACRSGPRGRRADRQKTSGPEKPFTMARQSLDMPQFAK